MPDDELGAVTDDLTAELRLLLMLLVASDKLDVFHEP